MRDFARTRISTDFSELQNFLRVKYNFDKKSMLTFITVSITGRGIYITFQVFKRYVLNFGQKMAPL